MNFRRCWVNYNRCWMNSHRCWRNSHRCWRNSPRCWRNSHRLWRNSHRVFGGIPTFFGGIPTVFGGIHPTKCGGISVQLASQFRRCCVVFPPFFLRFRKDHFCFLRFFRFSIPLCRRALSSGLREALASRALWAWLFSEKSI